MPCGRIGTTPCGCVDPLLATRTVKGFGRFSRGPVYPHQDSGGALENNSVLASSFKANSRNYFSPQQDLGQIRETVPPVRNKI